MTGPDDAPDTEREAGELATQLELEAWDTFGGKEPREPNWPARDLEEDVECF